MITGIVVDGREAVIPLSVRGANDREILVEAMLDTGFTDFLLLPVALIASLGLPFAGSIRAALADGSEVPFDVYSGTVIWDSQERPVTVLGSDGYPLVGMAMLAGYRVTRDVEDNGAVLIEALP
jgi:clan AA aspartic protease